MKENLDMHSLAVRYFEGRIERSDETRLYQFMKASKENYAQFKSWEREWLRLPDTDESVEKEWGNMQNKMRIRETLQSMLTLHKRVLWRRVAAVAAVVIFTIGATLGIWTSFEESGPEGYFTFEAPYGQRSKVLLADGTVVWLNAGSTLQYSNRFNDRNRKVKLNGEGYFEVTKRGGKLFTVETSGYNVVVKGTKFNVSAYSDDAFITTTLIEGRVELQHNDWTVKMHPGEALSLNRSSGKFRRENVDATQSKAWSEGRMVFNYITLNDLAVKLSRQYNVNIEIQSPSLGRKAFRLSLLNKETIGEVMTALQKLQPFTMERKGKNIYIRE